MEVVRGSHLWNATYRPPVGMDPEEDPEGAKALEEAVGARYRAEITDLGLGFAPQGMLKKLKTWGYVASREACQEWLRGYRLGDGAKDGGAGVYVLSRQQLQRWYHVDNMSPTELQEKYRVECGVYAHRAHLVRWLKVLLYKRERVVGTSIAVSSVCMS